MILDRLSNANSYHALGDRFRRGFEYLQANAGGNVPEGRHQIVGDDVVAIVAGYHTKSPRDGRWEAHRHHADIQFIATGYEDIGLRWLEENERPTSEYDASKDVEFYDSLGVEGGTLFSLSQGDFTVFLPHDVHMPNLMIDKPQYVKKIVVKVRLD